MLVCICNLHFARCRVRSVIASNFDDLLGLLIILFAWICVFSRQGLLIFL